MRYLARSIGLLGMMAGTIGLAGCGSGNPTPPPTTADLTASPAAEATESSTPDAATAPAVDPTELYGTVWDTTDHIHVTGEIDPECPITHNRSMLLQDDGTFSFESTCLAEGSWAAYDTPEDTWTLDGNVSTISFTNGFNVCIGPLSSDLTKMEVECTNPDKRFIRIYEQVS